MGKLKFSITGLFFIATFLISYAHEFEVDGIYYNRNADKKSVTVTYRGNYCDEYSNEYSGNVVIPSTVTYLVNTYYVTSIGERAFMGCIGLKSITIPNSVTSIGERAFEYCSGLTSITIPNSVTSIRRYAFAGCSGLTSVTIGNSVTSIGDSAFSNCSDLTSITIPNSVTSIGDFVFSWCSGLTSITIPNSVASIGDNAFYCCFDLNLIRCDAVTPPSLGSDVFYMVNQSTCTLLVPDQSISKYKAAEQWKDFLDISDAEMVTVDESEISVENGAIVNRSNQQIDVYSISGAKAYSGNDAEITLPSGIYVVKAGEKVVKLSL